MAENEQSSTLILANLDPIYTAKFVYHHSFNQAYSKV